MILKVLASSSEGNCYLLHTAGGDTLIIEAGIHFYDIKKALKFSIKNVVGCLVTHEHNDHARSVFNVLQAGIKVYSHEELFTKKEIKSPFANIVRNKQHFNVGNFRVTALQAWHDVQCFCYVVEHKEMGKLLFATDTFKLPYKITGLNHLLIECNYNDRELADREERGECPVTLRDRLMLTHMEMQTTKKVVKTNISNDLQTVVLLHLSKDNSNPELMTECISSASGVPIYIAEKGLEINLNKNPY